MDDREFYRQIGRKIYEKRIELELTRAELGELTGYTENSIKAIEVQGRGMSLYKWSLFERALGL